MRSFKSLSELGTVKAFPVQVNAVVNGRPKFISVKVPGGPSDPDSEAEVSKFLAEKGTLDSRVKGTLATGVNSKGKAIVPTTEMDIKGSVLASLLPWEAARYEAAERAAAEQAEKDRLAAEATAEPSEQLPSEGNRTRANGRTRQAV